MGIVKSEQTIGSTVERTNIKMKKAIRKGRKEERRNMLRMEDRKTEPRNRGRKKERRDMLRRE
jgi:hypothetical protein